MLNNRIKAFFVLLFFTVLSCASILFFDFFIHYFEFELSQPLVILRNIIFVLPAGIGIGLFVSKWNEK